MQALGQVLGSVGQPRKLATQRLLLSPCPLAEEGQGERVRAFRQSLSAGDGRPAPKGRVPIALAPETLAAREGRTAAKSGPSSFASLPFASQA
jgi:hypothetical protein